jgi:hypothetical protein
MDDSAKKAMFRRFACEQDDNDNNAATAPKEGEVVTNKQDAQQANMAKTQELKSRKATTKKEEQAKTKDDRLNKAQAKEDQKKRAVKGERKAQTSSCAASDK